MHCARCGQDLRGLTEPKCPACELEFDWADAVPLEQLTCPQCDYHLCGLTETRCPECGRTFTWPEVLGTYHRQKRPLFEYHWRPHPVRSFCRTWLGVLRPGRFWRNLSIHDTVHVKPLLAMLPVVFLVHWAASVAWCTLWVWAYGHIYWVVSQGMTFDWGTAFRGIGRCVPYAFTSEEVGMTVLFAVLWSMTSLGALLLFQQSMRRCKVRTAHVLRVWVYGLVLPLPVLPLVAAAWTCLGTVCWTVASNTQPPFFAAHVWPLAAVFMVWSVRCAYRFYLRMDRSLAVAVSSQFIALMAVLVILDLATPYGYSHWVLRAIMDMFGLP